MHAETFFMIHRRYTYISPIGYMSYVTDNIKRDESDNIRIIFIFFFQVYDINKQCVQYISKLARGICTVY